MKKLFYRLLSTQLILFSLTSVNIYAQDEFFTPKTTIGGYGELHFNHQSINSRKSKDVLDFHRFVTFMSYTWSEKWSFKAEIELEHNIVEGEKGALELEQAFVNYRFRDWLAFKAGVILPSIGLINEYHEPPTFLSVERPAYNKYIIPTTWFGNGLAVYGKYKGLDYKLTIMEGLNSDKFSLNTAIRKGRQGGFKADAQNPLVSLRINYLKVKNLKIGFSFTYNNSKGDSTNIPINLIEGHLQFVKKNLFIIGEYGQINYKQGKLKKSSGFYLDIGYNINSLINVKWEVIPFVRYSHYNTAASVRNNPGLEDKYNISKWMAGLSIKPIPQIAVKFDYAIRTIKSNNEKTELFNVGIGYMF